MNVDLNNTSDTDDKTSVLQSPFQKHTRLIRFLVVSDTSSLVLFIKVNVPVP